MTVVGGRLLGNTKDPEGVLTKPGAEAPTVPVDPPIPDKEKQQHPGAESKRPQGEDRMPGKERAA
jgi:hypothetical protein